MVPEEEMLSNGQGFAIVEPAVTLHPRHQKGCKKWLKQSEDAAEVTDPEAPPTSQSRGQNSAKDRARL